MCVCIYIYIYIYIYVYIYIYIYCKPQSRKLHDDHQPLALTAASNYQPLALAEESSAVMPMDESAILFSETAILNGESAILLSKAGRLTSEHSTDPVAPSVTSSGRGYIRRTPPGLSSMRELLLQNSDLTHLRRRQQQQPSGAPQLSLVEKQAIRWKGKPWLTPSPVQPPRLLWYVLWTSYRSLADTKRLPKDLSLSS